jgi:hypothetical protein
VVHGVKLGFTSRFRDLPPVTWICKPFFNAKPPGDFARHLAQDKPFLDVQAGQIEINEIKFNA